MVAAVRRNAEKGGATGCLLGDHIDRPQAVNSDGIETVLQFGVE
jgi:hypothetical protein